MSLAKWITVLILQSMEPGTMLHREFIDRHHLTLTAIGKRLDVSYVAVRHWVHGNARPNAAQREKIAILTGGLVPAESWHTEEEQAAIVAVTPLNQPQPPPPPPGPA